MAAVRTLERPAPLPLRLSARCSECGGPAVVGEGGWGCPICGFLSAPPTLPRSRAGRRACSARRGDRPTQPLRPAPSPKPKRAQPKR